MAESQMWAERQRSQDLASSVPRVVGPARPVTASPPGFTESSWGRRNPLVVVRNADSDTTVLTLSGPAEHQLVVGPYGTGSVEVLPGTYAVRMWSDEAPTPSTGWGVFSAFRKYTAVSYLTTPGGAGTLRMGELSGPGELRR